MPRPKGSHHRRFGMSLDKVIYLQRIAWELPRVRSLAGEYHALNDGWLTDRLFLSESQINRQCAYRAIMLAERVPNLADLRGWLQTEYWKPF